MSGSIRPRVSRRRFFKQAGVSTLAFIGQPEAAIPAETACQNTGSRATQTTSPCEKASMDCVVRPAVSSRAYALLKKGCRVRQEGSAVILANDYLSVAISANNGQIEAVTNKITRQRYALSRDHAGFRGVDGSGENLEWMADSQQSRHITVTLESEAESSRVVLSENLNSLKASLVYSLKRRQFWIERQIIVESVGPPVELCQLIYGRLEIAGATPRVLRLGKFDRPLLLSKGTGGVFAGVGFWFYEVDDSGVYQNADIACRVEGRFESEPWYLGVFQAEESEPYAGWLWYKNFLEMRKAAYDKQELWSYWNAGWGQWGIDIDDASAPPYIDLAHQLGVRSIAFGSGDAGKGLPAYLELARASAVAKKNLTELKKSGIDVGFLESGGLMGKWEQESVLNTKLSALKAAAEEGFGALHFDFFSTVDSYRAHRNVAMYLRAARSLSNYTECHLGMADYGPQFQREVLVNHPADLRGFELSHFSSDWTTLLGFRQSRSEWQRRFQYLMPEYGLYYFLTHYSNWGHPRQYSDPEPQQFLYEPHSYCGIAYNFHDKIGFRESIVAASAFSPFFVFGHLDLKMPASDAAFARDFQRWVAENIEIMRLGRVCLENEHCCVMSKIRDGRGCLFAVNYSPGEKTFRMQLEGLSGLRAQQVYPVRERAFSIKNGSPVEVKGRGESVVILDINNGLKSFPPENKGNLRIDLTAWERLKSGWKATFMIPDIRQGLTAGRDPSLPRKLLSLDQLEAPPSSIQPMAQPPKAMTVLGRGKLPSQFLDAYGFQENKIVDTWKIAPWAFADRVWLVYYPTRPFLLGDKAPALEVNGKPTPLIPRVDYRPQKVSDWKCPLLFADVTEQCRYGQVNQIIIAGSEEEQPSACYIISAAGSP